MSEQATCHKHEDGRWLYNTGVGWHPVIEGWRFCPDCGVGFGADGSETPMVPAVTSEAVRATEFWQVLKDAVGANGLSPCCPPQEMRVILAALQQSGLGTAQWLAERLAPGGQRDNPELYATYQSAEAWRRAALRAVQPAPEPGAER